MMHKESYFSNPELFLPTRWIESERRDETCNHSAWHPFSLGARNCIGQRYILILYFINCRLALMVMKLALPRFILEFDVELIEPGQKEPTYEDGLLTIKGPCPLRVTPVKANRS